MIVNTSIPYTSSILQTDITSLLTQYSFLRAQTIGYSVLGRPIDSLIIGRGSKKILYVASTHSNEWITSPLLMKFVEDFCYAYSNRLQNQLL